MIPKFSKDSGVSHLMLIKSSLARCPIDISSTGFSALDESNSLIVSYQITIVSPSKPLNLRMSLCLSKSLVEGSNVTVLLLGSSHEI